MASKIEWTGETWNPIVGCSVLSPGCTNCYAMRDAYRKGFNPRVPHYAGLTKLVNGNPVWTGKLTQAPGSVLVKPLHRKIPTTYFVNSMSDLFHEDVREDWIDHVVAIMAICPRHTFQILTKRAERMRQYFSDPGLGTRIGARLMESARGELGAEMRVIEITHNLTFGALPNVWLGVSCEDQKRAVERVPHLVATRAVVRFISGEPLLGEIDLEWVLRGQSRGVLHWLIVGGESGPRARRCHVSHIRSLVKQGASLGIQTFVKQLGANVIDRNDAGFDGDEPDQWPAMDYGRIEHDLDGTLDGYQGAPVRIHMHNRKGGDPTEWPPDLQVRQMPARAA